MKFTILLESEDDSSAPLLVAEIERTGPLNAATLGLTITESKNLLSRVQEELVNSQFQENVQEQRACTQCGLKFDEASRRDRSETCRAGVYCPDSLVISLPSGFRLLSDLWRETHGTGTNT